MPTIAAPYAQRRTPTRHGIARRKVSAAASTQPVHQITRAANKVPADDTGGTKPNEPSGVFCASGSGSRRSAPAGSSRRARCQPRTAIAVSPAAHADVPRLAQASGAHVARDEAEAKASRAPTKSWAAYARTPES